MRYIIWIIGAWLGLLAGGGFLEAQTKGKDKEADKEKATELGEIGGRKLDQWIGDLNHRDAAVRDSAIRTLALYGKSARKAVKGLIKELRDSDASLRVNAATALGLIGMDEADLADGVRALGRVATTDSQINVRYQAVLALGKIGADAKSANSQILTALKDPYNWELRQAAALALAGTGWEQKENPNNPKQTIWVADPKVVNALVAAAQKDYAARVRHQALISLIYLGIPNDPNQVQTEKAGLQLVLKDHDPIVAIWARVALMRIDKLSEVYLKDIAQMLKHHDVPVRTNAAQALAAIGASARSRVSDLLAALEDKEPLVIVAALNALVQLGDDSTTVVTTLERMMKETKDEGLKQAIKQASEQLKMRANELREANPKGLDLKAPPKKKSP